MTALPSIVDSNGRRITLERQLARGGEGTVYTLSGDESLVAKIYHQPPSPQTAEKLTAMVKMATPQLSTLAAWPLQLYYDPRSRSVAGFAMPRLNEFQPIQSLYNPVQRLKYFPRAGWDFQVRAARNLAAAFDEIHKAGALVGDVNQSNAFISSQALVRLIDCDSFQITSNGKPYLCEVGVAHYIPPELQGKPLRNLVRTENHDRFGLAVLIYQLLFVGRHPYAGIYSGPGDPSFNQLIAEYRFAQSPVANTWGMSPPPNIPTFNDIPGELAALFRRAFERGSERGTRPKPLDWINTLQLLESSITACASEAGHKYWSGVSECVWCRLAMRGGPEYYFSVSSNGEDFAVDQAKLQAILKRLERIEHPNILLDLSHYASKQRIIPTPLSPIAQIENDVAQIRAKFRLQEAEVGQIALEKEKHWSREKWRIRTEVANKWADQQQRIDADLASAYRDVEKMRRKMKAGNLTLGLLSGVGLLVTLLGYHEALALVALLSFIFAMFCAGWLAHRMLSLRSLNEYRKYEIIRQKRDKINRKAAKDVEREWDAVESDKDEFNERYAEKMKQLKADLRIAEMLIQNPARNELNKRTLHVENAKQRLQTLQLEWSKLVQTYELVHQQITSKIMLLIFECRKLDSQYQEHIRHVLANAESAARLRHLYLHSIADADIPNIGEMRKFALMAHGIFTAADVEAGRFQGIKGFGDQLIPRLLEWKEMLLLQFRFDATMEVTARERLVIVSKFQHLQHGIISQVESEVVKLESFVDARRTSLEMLTSKIMSAVIATEQADADLQIMGYSEY